MKIPDAGHKVDKTLNSQPVLIGIYTISFIIRTFA